MYYNRILEIKQLYYFVSYGAHFLKHFQTMATAPILELHYTLPSSILHFLTYTTVSQRAFLLYILIISHRLQVIKPPHHHVTDNLQNYTIHYFIASHSKLFIYTFNTLAIHSVHITEASQEIYLYCIDPRP